MSYTDFAYVTGAEVGPDGTLAYVSDASGRAQLWLSAGGESRHLPTPGSVRRATWRPDGAKVLVLLDPDGTEQHGLAEIDVATGVLDWVVSDAKARCELGPPYTALGRPYSADGALLAYSTTAREPEVFDVVVRSASGERTVLTGDNRYFAVGFSPDGRRLLVLRQHQNTDHDLFVVDLDTDEIMQLTGHDGPKKCMPIAWAPDGESVYVCTTAGRDFLGLARLGLDGVLQWIDTPDCDVSGGAVSDDGRTLAWARNHDGWSQLWWSRDGGEPRPVDLPPCMLAEEMAFGGAVLDFAPDGRVIALFARPDAATEGCAIDLETEQLELLTDSGRDLPRDLVAPTVVHATSANGLDVPCLLYRPPAASGEHPAPVVVTVHGGPEAQALPSYDPMVQALLARGIGVIAPNFRGSSGYGMRFQRLVYRDWGGGDLEDLAAAARLLADIGWADASRLGVHGASYGGFAAQSCLTRLPHLWLAGVSECGPCDQVADIESVPPTWRRRTKEWIGDPDDPDDLARLREHSPLTHAEDVRAPLLLLHGQNDTRVDPRASEKMYARLHELGKPVRLELHPGIGHEVDRQGLAETIDLVVEWFAENLLVEPYGPPQP